MEENLALKNTVNLIMLQIKHGVKNEQTGEIRKFDILDYYMLTSMSMKELMDAAKQFNIDATCVRRFFYENRVVYRLTEEYKIIMSNTFIINGNEITTEQKELVVKYLESINAPVTTALFKLAAKRYLNGELELEKIIKKTL